MQTLQTWIFAISTTAWLSSCGMPLRIESEPTGETKTTSKQGAMTSTLQRTPESTAVGPISFSRNDFGLAVQTSGASISKEGDTTEVVIGTHGSNAQGPQFFLIEIRNGVEIELFSGLPLRIVSIQIVKAPKKVGDAYEVAFHLTDEAGKSLVGVAKGTVE